MNKKSITLRNNLLEEIIYRIVKSIPLKKSQQEEIRKIVNKLEIK